jgi:hypothetical protein
MYLSNAFIVENVPWDGEWRVKCECGEPLVFSITKRGTPAALLVVQHGTGESRVEIDGTDRLAWVLGLEQPLHDWLERVHEYEDAEAETLLREAVR